MTLNELRMEQLRRRFGLVYHESSRQVQRRRRRGRAAGGASPAVESPEHLWRTPKPNRRLRRLETWKHRPLLRKPASVFRLTHQRPTVVVLPAAHQIHPVVLKVLHDRRWRYFPQFVFLLLQEDVPDVPAGPDDWEAQSKHRPLTQSGFSVALQRRSFSRSTRQLSVSCFDLSLSLICLSLICLSPFDLSLSL